MASAPPAMVLLVSSLVAPCAGMCSRPLPPPSAGLPLVGDTLKILSPKTMATYQSDSMRRHGPLWRTRLLFQRAIVVTGADAMAELAREEAVKPMSAFFPPQQKALFGPLSLLVNSGAQHSSMRRLVGQALTPAAVDAYAPAIDAAVDECIARCIEQGSSPDGVKLAEEMRRFTLRAGTRLMLGNDAPGDPDAIDALAADLTAWSKGLVAPPLFFLPWSTAARAVRARRRIEARLGPLVDAARSSAGLADPAGSQTRDGTLLVRLARATDEDGNTLERKAVLDNLLTLLFAGSDTTASGLTSCFRELSQSPSLQGKVRSAVTSRDDEHVNGLLDALLTEVQRCNPPAPFQMRLVGEQDLEVGGYRVPANWLVVYGYAGTLLADGQTYTTPGEVDINRWLGDKPPPNWAFGGGPRMCPGRALALAESLALLRKVLGSRGFEWRLLPGQDLQGRYEPGLFPVDRLQATTLPSQ